MKSIHWSLLVILFLIIGILNIQRWHEESQDRRIAIAADWNEFRDLSARQSLPDDLLMRSLHDHGATSLLLSPTSLADLYARHRLSISNSSSLDPFGTQTLLFQDPVLAKQVFWNLTARGAQDVHWEPQGRGAVLKREEAPFAALKDIEVGFDPLDIVHAQAAGLVPVFRLRQDPWMNSTAFFESLSHDLANVPIFGLIITSDDLPGGMDALPLWKEWLQHTEALQFYMEFHPSKASTQIAFAYPSGTYRAHTIPVVEMATLPADQQTARWVRAVQERSVRWLLMHVPPNDAPTDYLKQMRVLSDDLSHRGFVLGFPQVRSGWFHLRHWHMFLGPWIALILAVITPAVALRSISWESPYPSAAFFQISGITIVGALLLAGFAQNPYTRLEIVPFHGVKAAFMASWLGCVVVLYSWEELATIWSQQVKRWEILAILLAAVFVGYLLVRTGNASAEWKPPFEQHIRELLEQLMGVRPRFKEFAIGHPLLLIGLFFEYLRRIGRSSWDARPVIAVGMVGQVSMMNTFCHFHSPLRMELWRTFDGLILGWLLGQIIIWILQKKEYAYER